MFPWKFFNLTARDSAGPLIRNFNRRFSLSSAQAELITSLTVPLDQALIISGISAAAAAGALQQPLSVFMQIVPTPGTGISFQATNCFPTGVAVGAASSQGFVSIPLFVIAGPGEQVNLGADFTAGANINSVVIAMSAFAIPRGDMAYL